MPAKRERQLTPRQRIFVEKLIITGSGRKAAILAGVTPSQAGTRAHRWRKKPWIQERLRTLKQTAIRRHSNRIAKHLADSIRAALHKGIDSAEGLRALRLLDRLERMAENHSKVTVKSKDK